ncbi:EAL domain-containing protein [Pseudomaricurvus alkylphenolicus]|uniref:putative bifunctional diguanylate cyclase/phosphodiesterase n=1 Tax=Pseudomaricurvus alkylphenolicus TaxID=1306991 RepID=UPI00142263A6|nr:GGDEF domain-containing phosphodiesterase [Pseudomaricurvus alkylphenolicus]NIB40865.1 EAL domain-containing protein [Pseudomaricurvus alkylphenolicus]
MMCATMEIEPQQLIHELSAYSGEEYFAKLVEKLSRQLGLDYVIVGQFLQSTTRVRTLAVWNEAGRQENFEYELAGTPCRDLSQRGICCFAEGITKLYPADKMLVDLDMESYIGVVLRGKSGEPLGLLVALGHKPIEHQEWLVSAFELFALRASAELERFNYETRLTAKISELEDKNERLRVAHQVYDFTTDGIIVTDADNRIVYVNRSLERISGYSEQELLGGDPSILNSGLQSREFYRSLWQDLQTKGWWKGEFWNRHKNGKTYPVLTSISTVPGKDGQTASHVAIHRDISDQKEAQQLISYQAAHDQLTGLFNRYEFNARLEHQLAALRDQDTVAALLLMDIDHFKSINDSMGHHVGDELVKQVADRVSYRLRNDDLFARLGGDEFAIFATFDSVNNIETLANKILSLFEEPFILKSGSHLKASTSIGISLFRTDALEAKNLISCADQALYRAKGDGRDTFAFFSEELRVQALRHLQVRQRLERALDADAIEPWFQPIVHIESGRVSHFEALARWRDEELGTVYPDEFIAVAEQSGLIQRLGQQLSIKAMRYIHQLNQQLEQPVGVAINRSPQEFMNAGKTPDPVASQAQEIGLSPELVCIELTESLMVKNPTLAGEYLRKLKQQGITLSMDDFGTGFSSLAYLKMFPFDILKIDKSFVMEIDQNPGDFNLVKTIIEMANNFGMKTVAEGVETPRHLELLRELGCSYAQGYHYSPALEFRDLPSYLSTFLNH